MYTEAPAVAYKASWRGFFQGRNWSTFLNQFFHIFLSPRFVRMKSYKDVHVPRRWSQASIAPEEIRLVDGDFMIRIDLAAKAIFYSDNGGNTGFRRLDTITSVVRAGPDHV